MSETLDVRARKMAIDGGIVIKPATDEQKIATVKENCERAIASEEGMFAPCTAIFVLSLIARIRLEVEVADQVNDNCKILNADNDSLDDENERLRVALEKIAPKAEASLELGTMSLHACNGWNAAADIAIAALDTEEPNYDKDEDHERD